MHLALVFSLNPAHKSVERPILANSCILMAAKLQNFHLDVGSKFVVSNCLTMKRYEEANYEFTNAERGRILIEILRLEAIILKEIKFELDFEMVDDHYEAYLRVLAPD